MAFVLSIYIASTSGAPALQRDSVMAVPGRGIEGDRYFDGAANGGKLEPGEEITLIESEQVDAFNAEHGTTFAYGDMRRNVVTRGVDLNALVGKRFVVGDAELEGIELCEPCLTLAKITDPRVLPGLVHRAGLRARIVEQGTIGAGDAVAIRPDGE
jgi:MOSC domain-containing protein YiiM